MFLDLTQGITETEYYKAFKFPGGEIHFILKDEFIKMLYDIEEENEPIDVSIRLKCSDDIIFLGIVLDTLAKTTPKDVYVFIPYFPYQQADRDFAMGESFSLITMTKILSTFACKGFRIYDPHSDVTPALLAASKSVQVTDNADFIYHALQKIGEMNGSKRPYTNTENLVILSPDAGAYKKIFKLADKIRFKGQIECANKFRPSNGGEPQIRLSTNDFGGKDILVIDDICIGGRTFAVLANELKDKNVGNLYLAISHGIFSNGYIHLESRYKHLFTTNSIQHAIDYKYLCKNIDVYDIMPSYE
jgi:ribose-phosphate pyrophosphokinase